MKDNREELYDLGYDVETLCDNVMRDPEGMPEYTEHEYEGKTFLISVRLGE